MLSNIDEVLQKPVITLEYMEKICKTCKQSKPLSDFFCAPKDGAAGWTGTSSHCIECHDKGLVKYGYGWYGDLYRRPSWHSQ